MRRIWEISRRRFLWLLGALGLVQAGGSVASNAAPAAEDPVPGFNVLTANQVAVLEAIAEQIIPADQDPGAREAGAVRYIDRVLAAEQRDRLPLYVSGLAGVEQTSRAMFGSDFIQLSFDRQTAVLKAIEQGKASGDTWKKASSADFFATVWNHVLEGFYGPAEHGGNKDYASWKMVGFPEHSGTL